MNIFEKLSQKIKNLFGKKALPQLNSGEIEEKSTTSNSHKKFVEDLQKKSPLQKSPEEIALEEKNLTEKAAYRCLAMKSIGLEKPFNMDYLGQSQEKSYLRLQAEESFKNFGRGSELPIDDEKILIFQKIGQMHEEAKALLENPEKFYNSNNPLINLMNDKNIGLADIDNILLEKGKSVSERIQNEFKQKGGSFISFNIDDELPLATDILESSIKDIFEEQIDNSREEV